MWNRRCFLQKISYVFGAIWSRVIMVENSCILNAGLVFGYVFPQLLKHAAIIFAIYRHFKEHILLVKHSTIVIKYYQHNFSGWLCVPDFFLPQKKVAVCHVTLHCLSVGSKWCIQVSLHVTTLLKISGSFLIISNHSLQIATRLFNRSEVKKCGIQAEQTCRIFKHSVKIIKLFLEY